MTVSDAFAQRCLDYVMAQAPVLYFILDSTGRILEINRYTEKTLGIARDDTLFQALVLDFEDRFDLADPDMFLGEHLMSVHTLSGYPASYLFSFRISGGNIQVFGHKDPHEMENMEKEMLQLNQDLGNSARQLHKKNAQLRAALDDIKTLRGIIPICSFCHKIRSDDQSWQRLEAYLGQHTHADFSHGVCPECMKIHYPEDGT